MAIPAGGILLAAAGGVLAYAGFTGMNPLEALKDIASGKPSGISHSPSTFITDLGTSIGNLAQQNANAAGGAPVTGLPSALQFYTGDKYSKARRWQTGYSDCSSFIGKGLKREGIKPPGPSITTSYLASKEWVKISAASAKPGDLIVSTTHMVCYLGDGRALGQQNPRRNVQEGTVKDLMYGTGGYVYLRYAVSGGSAGGKLGSSGTSV